METLSNMAYWGAFALWGLLELAGAFTQRRNAKRRDASDKDRGSIFLIIASLWAGLLLAGYASQSVLQVRWNWNPAQAKVFAAVVILLGILLRQYAIRILGRYFTQDVAVSKGQQLVQTGPYRFIRHPAYTGTLISVIGIALGMTNWLSLTAAAAGFLIGHLYRIRVEEQALIAYVGKSYEEYMRRTKRLIPFVF
jgi:protein-S-isoprenylcysteine O-methyltransferase Ste14